MTSMREGNFIPVDITGKKRMDIVRNPPPRDTEFEDNFYFSLINPSIYKKWLDLVYSNTFNQFCNVEEGLMWLMQQLFLKREDILDLFELESQRRLEMYYINKIILNVQNGVTDFRGLIPSETFMPLLSKYPKLNTIIKDFKPRTKRKYTKSIKVPEYTPQIDKTEKDNFKPEKIFVKKVIQKTPGKRGRPLGRTEFDRESDVKYNLIHCVPIVKMSKTLGYSQQTIHNVMERNAFTKPESFKKDVNTYLESVKAYISRYGGTWGEFIERHTICERALFGKLYNSDPDFITKYNIMPTPHSVLYELEQYVMNRSKVAKAFGVPVEMVNEWIRVYKLIGSHQMGVKVERRGGFITEEQEHIQQELLNRRKRELMESRK